MNYYNNYNPYGMQTPGYSANYGGAYPNLTSGQITGQSTLTKEQMELLKNKAPQVNLVITEEDVAKASCNHQGVQLIPIGPSMYRCPLCGEEFETKTYSDEDLKRILGEFRNLVNYIKVTDRILPDGFKLALYKAGAVIDKMPEAYRLVVNNANNLTKATNPYAAATYGGRDAFRTIDGILGGNGFNYGMPIPPAYAPQGYAQAQPGYNQPYAQPQPMGYPQAQPQPYVNPQPQPAYGQPMGYAQPQPAYNQGFDVNPMNNGQGVTLSDLNRPGALQPAPTGGVNSAVNNPLDINNYGNNNAPQGYNPNPRINEPVQDTSSVHIAAPSTSADIEIDSVTGKPIRNA